MIQHSANQFPQDPGWCFGLIHDSVMGCITESAAFVCAGPRGIRADLCVRSVFLIFTNEMKAARVNPMKPRWVFFRRFFGQTLHFLSLPIRF